jgi:hypothetical protein
MVKGKFGAHLLALVSLVFLLWNAYPARAYEIRFDFEGNHPLAGFTVDGWGVRDSTCQYGPQTFPSGSQAVGVPETCQPGYPNGNGLPGNNWIGTLTTPAVALTSVFPSLYLGWTYWSDFEGVTATFDGVIIEMVNLTQGTTVQIDSLAQNDLCPTYDDIIGITNPRLEGLWAYCYDTLAPTFNSLGYPFVVLQSIRPGGEVPSRPRQHPNMPTDFEWRNVVSVDLIAAGYANPGDTVQFKWTFASDQLANGAGYFMDDLFISSDPPTDLQPPSIDVVSPEMWADIPDSNQPITVTATITEGCAGSGVNPDSVFLIYDDEDTTGLQVNMTNTGGDTYEGQIPGYPYDTDIRYRVKATDNAGNTGASPWRHLEVTDAITLKWDDGVPASVYTGLEAGDGFTVRYQNQSSGDTVYVLHKIMYYFGNANGLFDVVVNFDAGGQPGAEIYRENGVTNGDVANTFYEYELPDSTVQFSPGQAFHVGMRLASPDTLLDPQQLIDGVDDYSGESWVIAGGGINEVVGETMIRCKVKKRFVAGVGDHGGPGISLPRAYSLGQNFPNPFNPSTTIRFAIPARDGEDAAVQTRLSIYNLRGELIRTLVNAEKDPGEYSVQWDGTNVRGEKMGSGVYLYRLQAGDFTSTKKMVVVK